MNAMNRGSLRAIRQTLRCIDNLLVAMINAEANKEMGGNGGAPFPDERQFVSDKINDVSELLREAIDKLDEIAEQPADWEEELE